MSNLSELLPTGGGQNSVDFVATGTLASGQAVVLKSNGQVEAISATGSGSAVGSGVVFDSAAGLKNTVTYDSTNNKVVIAFRDAGNSNYGTAVVGTVSGLTITFGTPVVFEAAAVQNVVATFDSSNNKIVIAYEDDGNSSYGTAIVGTVSGTSISFGTAAVFISFSVNYLAITFDSTNNKIVVFYNHVTSGNEGWSNVGTVSGTSISFGSNVEFHGGYTGPKAATFDTTSSKVVICYADWAISAIPNARVGTVSGTSISYGAEVVIDASTLADFIGVVYDSSNNKVVVTYQDGGGGSVGVAYVGTVSGTSISFGSKVIFNNSNTTPSPPTFDSSNNKVVIAYRENPAGSGRVINGTVSGTSISFNSELVFANKLDTYGQIGAAFDSTTNQVVIAYEDDDNSDYGTAVVYTVTSSNYTSFIGITAEAISNTATGAVNVYGGIAASASATLPAVLSAGTAAVFEAATTSKVSATFDSNSNKVVIAYQDEGNSNYGTAVIGTVSGTTISYGTPVVFDAGTTSYMGITFDSSSNKAVIAYTDGSNIKAIVGTVSGTSISFGTAVQFNTGATNYPISLSFDSTANKVVISYNNQGNSDYGTSIVGTVSGTSISFGTAAVFISAGVGEKSSAYDSTNNKTAIAFINAAGHLVAIVATLSGTSLTFGSVATNSLASESPCAVFDPVNNKIVIAYKQSVGTASVCTISGTSISLGTPVVFNNSNTASISGAYNVDKSNIVFVAHQFGAAGIAVVGTVSGASISFGAVITFESGEIGFTSSVYDSVAKKTLAAYQDTPNSYYGTATVFTQSAGVLTIASDYYVQADGSLSTTTSTVKAGQAISATTINLKDLT